MATLDEAEAFAKEGFTDITWAFPIIPSRITAANRLAESVSLNVLVDSVDSARLLASAGRNLGVYIKVDCGYHRVGLLPNDPELIETADLIDSAENLNLLGLLTHAGHAYECREGVGISEIAEQERIALVQARECLNATELTLSVGSTPTLIHSAGLAGISEARAGNYVFFDLMQRHIGSCSLDECSLSVLTTVVSTNRAADSAVIDAGALSLSKDPGPEGHFGAIWDDYQAGSLSDVRVKGLSQEHGKLDRWRPLGQRLRILPNHACLAAALFDTLHVVEGDRVVDSWPVRRSH